MPVGSSITLDFTGAPYTPPSGSGVTLLFTTGSLFPAMEFEIVYGRSPALEFEIRYNLPEIPAWLEFEIFSGFILTIGNEFIIVQGSGVELEFEIYSAFTFPLGTEFVIVSNLQGEVGMEFEIVSNSILGMEFEIVYAGTTVVGMEFDIDYRVFTSVAMEFEIAYDIRNINVIGMEFEITSPILEQISLTIVNEPITLEIGRQIIVLDEADVSIDEGQFAWVCHVTLSDPAHFDLFHAEELFTIHLPDDDYVFIVDSKELAREEPKSGSYDVRASVGGISPSAKLSDPRAIKITKTWDTAMLASAIAEEVLQGYPFVWATIDWSIPAFRLGVDNQSPIQIIQLLAKAVGALVETDPDGLLVIRPTFPVSVPLYPTTEPDQVYSDFDNVMVLSEKFVQQALINKLRILDKPAEAQQDTVEWVVDELDPTKGKLHVFPSPWRETPWVEHTSLPIVSAVPSIPFVQTQEFDETVEVLRGEGGVSHPLFEIVTLEWLYEDLSGIVFDSDSRNFRSTHPTKTESLLHIVYRTRFLTFDVAAFSGAIVQFLVKDTVDA